MRHYGTRSLWKATPWLLSDTRSASATYVEHVLLADTHTSQCATCVHTATDINSELRHTFHSVPHVYTLLHRHQPKLYLQWKKNLAANGFGNCSKQLAQVTQQPPRNVVLHSIVVVHSTNQRYLGREHHTT